MGLHCRHYIVLEGVHMGPCKRLFAVSPAVVLTALLPMLVWSGCGKSEPHPYAGTYVYEDVIYDGSARVITIELRPDFSYTAEAMLSGEVVHAMSGTWETPPDDDRIFLEMQSVAGSYLVLDDPFPGLRRTGEGNLVAGIWVFKPKR